MVWYAHVNIFFTIQPKQKIKVSRYIVKMIFCDQSIIKMVLMIRLYKSDVYFNNNLLPKQIACEKAVFNIAHKGKKKIKVKCP